MRKPAVVSMAILLILASLLTVSAQTSPPSDSGTNLAVTIITFVLLVAVFVFIGFAAYKLIKKWSGA